PLTYWISNALRSRLASLAHIEGGAARVRQGIVTADAPRFVRFWWEVRPSSLQPGCKWMAYAKSSQYSLFWDDISAVVEWEGNGAGIRSFPKSRPQNTTYFGKVGVTYPATSVLGFNPRAFPAGCAFGHKGSVAFPMSVSAETLLGYLSSRPLEYILSFSIGA